MNTQSPEIPVKTQSESGPLEDAGVTPKEREFFVSEGYLIRENLVTSGEVEEIRQDAARICRGEYPCENLRVLPPETSDAEVLKRVLCIHQPHYVSAVMEKYMRHPKICDVLSKITAAHMPYWDGSVKCMQTMLFIKPPGFQGQAWHQDEYYLPTRDRSLIGAWIALDDATIENGCLWVIPQSHRSGVLHDMKPHGNPDEFDSTPEAFGFDDREAIPVEVKAGTVVFFNGYLLHRSKKNRSDIYRRVLVSHYMNAQSPFPMIQNPDNRKIWMVAGKDHYAWRGYESAEQNVYLRMCKAAEEAVKK
ncbi:MAG: phytanoyl-CoA dioxygenase family protein [Verrucomicrobiae bacterium]|nr:phytanoyl-CoA dioxygenase family protein [Verrucomicrobiae bacterium]